MVSYKNFMKSMHQRKDFLRSYYTRKIRQPSVQIGVSVGAGFPRPGRGDLAPTSFIADGLIHR